MNELQLDRVCKSFGPRAVLRDFSLTVDPGERVCVMGPSGCGKTTLLRLIAGLEKPDGGEIRGVPRRISAVFQEDRLCEGFSAAANVRVVTGRAVSGETIAAHLRTLGLGDSLAVPVRQLSGGMRRRAALARAVLFGGDLFLLDEAFKGLDAATRTLAMDYVLRGTAGKTAILVTHDPAEAAYFGGRVIPMETLSAPSGSGL
jgi:NitT/TauT family transport system ATP-binding protein